MNRNEESYLYGEEGANQNVTVVKIGGSLAVALLGAALALLSLGGTLAILFLGPQMIDSRAQASSAFARQTAQEAERESRVAIEQVDYMRVALAEKGIHVPSNH